LGNALDSSKALQGPCKVALENASATIELPEKYIFVKKDFAKKLLEREGYRDPGVSGIIIAVNKEKKADFEVICKFDECGYVKDDDAEKLNPDEILKSYKEGSKTQNEDRKNLGLPPIFVGGWAEKPHYEKQKHQVIWALNVKEKDDPSAPVTSVNYNTRILGRRGVLSLNMITEPNLLDANKVKVASLLNATTFNAGQSYADFVPGKDKAAEFGIAGLILGGGALAAAAKFGVFGVLAKWGLGILLVLKKFIILAIAGIGAFFTKIFKKKPKDPGSTNTPL
jgi:uncharacterized membrane-anchored protein